jgi:hypothetical protein
MFSLDMSSHRGRVRALALTLLLSLPATARAQDADALIKQGVDLRRAHDDEGALEQFRRAYDLEPTPRALAQMGLAEQALGRWVDGEAHLTRALEAADDPWIAKYRPTLVGSRVEIAKHLGSLTVTGGPDGAELRVDGRPAGTLPVRRTLRLPLGTLEIEARSGGRVLIARAVSIVAGLSTRVDLSASGAPSPALSAPAAAPRAAPAAGLSARNEDRETTTGSFPTRRQLAWISAGGALVVGGAGGVLLSLGNRSADEYNAGSCQATPGDSCDSLRRRGAGEQVAGVVGLVAGATLAATSVTFFILSGAGADGETRIACAPALGAQGAVCALRF